jgi:hypothetical protein
VPSDGYRIIAAMADASPLEAVTAALHRADAEGFARGYEQARAELQGADAGALLLGAFADAMDSAAGRLSLVDGPLASHLSSVASSLHLAVQPVTVQAHEPADGARDVPADQPVAVTFGREVDPGSVELAVQPAQGGQALAGEVSYDERTRTATFAAAHGLTPGVAYRATARARTPGAGGREMEPFEWTFTA